MTIKTAGVIAFNSKKTSVLLVKHLKKSNHRFGVYGLPAGKCKKNETEIETALREFSEETGKSTKGHFLKELPKTYSSLISQKSENVQMTFKVFVCKKHSGKLRKNKETDPEWIQITELSSVSLLPNVFEAITESLKIVL